MQNGDAFNAFIEETGRRLEGKTVLAYYQEPLGSETDVALDEIVTRFMAATAAQHERFQAGLDKPMRSLLGIYGHRAATRAVREESRVLLLQGLVGMGITNYTVPPKRNVEVGVAIFHHCARKLGESPIELFDEAAKYTSPHMATFFEQFGRRANVTLRRYGWQELKTPEGVRYKFEWG
ncbi:MAG: hypothetical protein AAF614_38015 [Chloroflexota bacterium]